MSEQDFDALQFEQDFIIAGLMLEGMSYEAAKAEANQWMEEARSTSAVEE